MIINIWAVLVATVASIVLGFLWYGPFFGKPWIRLMKVKEGDIDQSGAGMGKRYAIMTVGTLLTSGVLAYFSTFIAFFYGKDLLQSGICAAFSVWIGFIAPITLGGVLWEDKPWKLWFINAGYQLVALMISGIIIGLWI